MGTLKRLAVETSSNENFNIALSDAEDSDSSQLYYRVSGQSQFDNNPAIFANSYTDFAYMVTKFPVIYLYDNHNEVRYGIFSSQIASFRITDETDDPPF